MAVVAMSQLMQAMAVLPQAAPMDVLAALLGRLHETSLANQADRRAALEEARLARRDAADRAEATAAARLEERVLDDAERVHCRLEDIARRDQEAVFRLERADEEQARRAQSVAVTKTKLHADVGSARSRGPR